MHRLVIKQRFWLRLTSIFVTCLFLFNEISFAGGQSSRSGEDTLSPVSRLSPLADIKNEGGALTVEENPHEIFKSFSDEALFIYLSKKVGTLLIRFGGKLAPDNLALLLERDLVGKDFSRFNLDGIYEENGSYCLPYRRAEGAPPYVFRYYLPDNMLAGSDGEISLKIGSGEVRVLCESSSGRPRNFRGETKDLPAANAEEAVRGLIEKEKGKTLIVPVCQSNIVRSPQIELSLRHLIRKNGMEDKIGVVSGGMQLGTRFGDKLPNFIPYTIAEGLGLEEDLEYMDKNFYNKPITRELAAAADLIIVTNATYKLDLFVEFPEVKGLYDKIITYAELRGRQGEPQRDLADEISIADVYETISENFTYLTARAMRHRDSSEKTARGNRALADGAPHSIYCMLKDELREWATVEDIRLLTEGRMSDGHLGDGTVKRDLDTLISFGLVTKRGNGEEAVYNANPELTQDQWQKIDPILRALGTRPTGQEISAAAKKIEQIVFSVTEEDGSVWRAAVQLEEARPATVEAGNIIKPFASIPPGEVKNILVYNMQRYYSGIADPKLGETIIDLWPVVTELWKKFPDATIHLAAAYPDIFQAQQFQGRIVSLDKEALKGEEGRIKFLSDVAPDMIVEVSPAPVTFSSVIKKLYPEPGPAAAALGRPYYVGIASPASMTGAMDRVMLRDPSPILFVDREGREYKVEGLGDLTSEISEESFAMMDGKFRMRPQMKKAGSWNYSMGVCRMLGLDVNAGNLCHIELSLEEAVAALKWLERCHYAPGGRPFDPMKKIVVVNVYAVTQSELISDEDWVDIIYALIKTVDNAYFVFTHGGIMDKDFQYVNDIIKGVEEKMNAEKLSGNALNGNAWRNEIILPRVPDIYPHINNILGVASAVVSLDTGFTHLTSGVYAVPTAIITHNDIVQWMPPRDTAEGIILPNVPIGDLMQLSFFDPETYLKSKEQFSEKRKEILTQGIKVLADSVNKRSEWPSARSAKIAALSSRMRATLDKRLLASPLPISLAVRGLVGYVSASVRGLGMANLGLIPRVVVVDSAKQMGIGIPRFKFKLYTDDDGEVYLLIDKSAFDMRGTAAEIERAMEFMHEVVGHRLVRMLFPEFMEAGIEALKRGDRKDILVTKTAEEVLACLVTIMAISQVGHITATLTREEERERLLWVCPGFGEVTPEARIRAVMDDLLVRNQELNAYWYKEVIQKWGESIKQAVLSSYMPVVERFFRDRTGQSLQDPNASEEVLDIGGKQFGLKALRIAGNYSLLEVYDAAGGKEAYISARYGRDLFTIPGSSEPKEDKFSAKLGISRAWASSGKYGQDLTWKLLEIFFKKYPEVSVIHRTVSDPMLLFLAQEYFGFKPEACDEKNAVYIRMRPGAVHNPELWIPDPQMRLLFLTSSPGLARPERFAVLAVAPEDPEDFTRVYLSTTYVRPAGEANHSQTQEAPLADAAVHGTWPLAENSVDMVVSRASVSFLAGDKDGELYDVRRYASEYASHGEEDYSKTLGLKKKRSIAKHISSWQNSHPEEVFSLLDLGAGKGGLIKDLARDGQELDGKRLVVTGVNRPEEKDVWKRFTDTLIPQCTALAGASIEYFDFFSGWNMDNDMEFLDPRGITSRDRKVAYFTKQLLRVLKPGGEAHIQVGVLSDGEISIVKRVVDAGEKPGIVNYRNGVLHMDLLEPDEGLSGPETEGGAPAIALIKVRGEWKPFKLDEIQHMFINLIWRSLWDKGYELPADDTIVLDLRHRLGRLWDGYPVHVHSPPGDLIYDQLYARAASVEMNLPARGSFRLVTHPGTFRDEKGPRSLNLLVPREELVFLRTLRTKDPKAYSRWLDHEAEHLLDRATTKKGLELKETKITKMSPYNELLAAYNEHGEESRAKGEKKLEEIEKQIERLYDNDELIAADAAVKLGRLYSSNDDELDPMMASDAVSGLLYRAAKNEKYASIEAVRALVLLSERFEFSPAAEAQVWNRILGEDVPPELRIASMDVLLPGSRLSPKTKKSMMHKLLQELSQPRDEATARAIIELAGNFDYFEGDAHESVLRHVLSTMTAVTLTGSALAYFDKKAFALDHTLRRLAMRQIAKIFKQVAAKAAETFLWNGREKVTPRELREIYKDILVNIFAVLNPAEMFYSPDPAMRRQAVVVVQKVSRAYFAAMRAILNSGKALSVLEEIEETENARRELLVSVGEYIFGPEPREKDYTVRRQILDIAAEFMCPGFVGYVWILPRIFDLEPALVPGTSASLVELVVKVIQKSKDHRGLVVLRQLASNSESALGREIAEALGDEAKEFAVKPGGPSGRPVRLQIPSPRGYIPDMDERMRNIVDNFCRPAEGDPESVLPDKYVSWNRVNNILLQKGLRTFGKDNRPVIHIINVGNDAEESGFFGFPLSLAGSAFIDSIPVISYVSQLDGKLHIFMTAAFYDDYIGISHMNESISKARISNMRLAEILDHEVFEASEEAKQYPEEERHNLASARAQYFIPDRQTISCFHKWVIDSLVSTPEGRDYLVLLLDEYRSAQPPDRKGYEEAFYEYAKSVLPRKKYSREVQRLAHHLMRVYSGGDEKAFADICARNNINDPQVLDRAIQLAENKHILNAVKGFEPDVTITDTSETTVEIDIQKGIVKKSLKSSYADFIWDTLMKDDNGKMSLSALFKAGFNDDFMVVYREEAKNAIDYIYALMEEHLDAGLMPSGSKGDAVRALLRDYVDQLVMLNSYLTAQKRLGGLIADFAIIEGRIYQRKVIPLSVYLQHLIAGTGPFAGRKNAPEEIKTRIAKSILERYLGCIKELAKRGAVITNSKITNFGVDENGDVVLFDLGRSSLSWIDRNRDEALGNLMMLQIKLAVDSKRIADLNGELNAEETGVDSAFVETEKTRRIQEEWTRMWLRLVSDRNIPEDSDIETDLFVDGAKIVKEIEDLLPATAEDAEKEYRKITFMPTDMAEEETLEIIMEKAAEAQSEAATSRTSLLPDGSPARVFSILKDELKGKWVSVEDVRVLTKGRAADGHLSTVTVMRDLGTLGFLRLVVARTYKEGEHKATIFRAADLSPPAWEALRPVLEELGPRPDPKMKADAAKKIGRILSAETPRSLTDIKFATHEIRGAHIAIEAFDEKGRNIAYLYAQGDENAATEEGTRPGIRGIFIEPQYRGKGLAGELMKRMLERYPEIRVLHASVMNPVLRYMAGEHFSFVPRSPEERNKAYLKLPAGSGEKGELWIPNAELRSNYGFGPEETMRGSLNILKNTPKDISGFKVVYLNTAYERPVGAKDASYWGETSGPYPANPYVRESNIGRSFRDLDSTYSRGISAEIIKRINKAGDVPVKVLLIGVGRGAEAFELMHIFGPAVEVTATAKEDLLYRTGEELSSKLSDEAGYLGPEEAEKYIKDLRTRYLKCDLDKGIPLGNGTFDIVAIDDFSLGYVKNKLFGVEEMVRVAKEGGVVFCAPRNGYINTLSGRKTFGSYFAGLKDPRIFSVPGGDNNRLRIYKRDGLALPGLEVAESVPEMSGGVNKEAPLWTTGYRETSRKKDFREARFEGKKDPDAYYRWLGNEVLVDRRNLNIRPVAPQDIGAVRELSKRISAISRSGTAIEKIANGMSEDMADIYVYEDNGEVSGYVYSRYKEGGAVLSIEEIAVSEKFEGKGVASLLLARALKDGLELGVSDFEVRVKATVGRSAALFKRFGFSPLTTSPPGTTVHYSLSLETPEDNEDAPAADAKKDGKNSAVPPSAGKYPLLPLTPESIMELQMGRKEIDTPSLVEFMQDDMVYSMSEGGFMPRIGYISIPESLDDGICKMFSTEMLSIACFPVKAHIDEDGRALAPFPEEYALSIMVDGRSIGHGIAYKLSGSGTVNFRFSIHGGIPGGPDHRMKGYGSEALALIMAMSAKGGIFTGPVEEFAFPHRLSDVSSDEAINGIMRMINLLDRAGFDESLRFNMKGLAPGVSAGEAAGIPRNAGPDGPVLELKISSSGRNGAGTAISEFVVGNAGMLGNKQMPVEDALHELVLNVNEHGKGGNIRVFLEEGEKIGSRVLRIVSEDNGPGLDRDVNELVRNSVNLPRGAENGRGMRQICLSPDRATVEYGGKKYTRVTSDPVSAKWFGEPEKSDVNTGTVFTLDFDLPTGPGKKAKKLLPAGEAKKGTDVRTEAACAFMKEIVMKAASGEKLIIGVDTSWVPGLQEADIENLLTILSKIQKKKGFDNIIIKRGKGEALAGILDAEIKRTGVPLANVVIIGSEPVIFSESFDRFRENAESGKNAFFAGVSLPEDFKETSYTRMLEMITMALRLSSGSTKEEAGMSEIEVMQLGPRSFIFIPKASPLDFEIYKIQAKYINTSA